MKTISLTQGKFALVDDEDFERVSRYKWQFGSYGYAVANIWNKNTKTHSHTRLHRFILNAERGTQIDHKDLNKLNNTKSNLRFCNTSQNMLNAGVYRTNTTGYKGVYLCKRKKKISWYVQIRYQGKQVFLGIFTDIKKAAQVYNQAALKYHGEFARLNNI